MLLFGWFLIILHVSTVIHGMQFDLLPITLAYQEYDILPKDAVAYKALQYLISKKSFKNYDSAFIPITTHDVKTWRYWQGWQGYRCLIAKNECVGTKEICGHWPSSSYKGGKPYNPALTHPILLDEKCSVCHNNKKATAQLIGIELHPEIVQLQEGQLRYVLAQLLTKDDLIFNKKDQKYQKYSQNIKEARAQCKKGILFPFPGMISFLPLHKILYAMGISTLILFIGRALFYEELNYIDGGLGIVSIGSVVLGGLSVIKRENAYNQILKNSCKQQWYLHQKTIEAFSRENIDKEIVNQRALECYQAEAKILANNNAIQTDIYAIPHMQPYINKYIVHNLNPTIDESRNLTAQF